MSLTLVTVAILHEALEEHIKVSMLPIFSFEHGLVLEQARVTGSEADIHSEVMTFVNIVTLVCA